MITRPRPRATLKSVADRAGVAVSTASLVFSGKRHVAEATRQKVLKAAEELDYGGPDPLASSLRQGRSGVIGVYAGGRLRSSFRDPFAVSVLDGLSQYLGEHGSGILLIPAQGESEQEVVAQMSGIPFDAVTFPLGGNVSDEVLAHLRARRIPLVAAGHPTGDDIYQIAVDDKSAMRTIAQHLYDLGHRKVAMIALPDSAGPGVGPSPVNPEAQARTEGFREVFPDAVVVTADESTIPGGFAAGTEVLASHPDVTAIAAQSDLLAVGIIQALGARGLSTPGDVSVTGFDGIDLPWLTGTLTTIDQHGIERGLAIGQLVTDALGGDGESKVHQWTFIEGSSTDVPPQTTQNN